ncbi:6-phosphogluconolactonase [Dyadobacter fermentans]|uniref:6-phosphogluconolactonase n=1 Tax=Dyadobacter fermentans (strain ATCC 700827 / DSM 18053 / CIP 107007 / KCTC 52180 / NS114) TaxID=471854 RepID=C6VSE7_DYAFD|nr:6-phosphogluconolactonase [Dyadobacter fermentans]ACT96382.1 6-phosphogluconolactonase [Dyadobacter fermentans DSM 18053]
MELHIEKDTKALSASLAEWINNYIQQVLAKQDRFTFVLSGGSTPKALYALLAESPYKESVPWEKLHFFWGDERAVPFEDSRNNAKMCYDELLDKVPVKAENIHIMRTDITPEESAAEYEKIMKTYFEGSETTFDFVLLGMGDDGHTLSLFPGTEVIHEQEALATSFFLQAQDMYRITLTAPVVNNAACVAFLAAGAGKAEVLKQVLKGERNIDLYPSQIIQPSKGQLHWFVDEAAVALL